MLGLAGLVQTVAEETAILTIHLGDIFRGFAYQWQNGNAPYKTLDELLEETGAEKVNLVGHSLGGRKVTLYSVEYPEKVDECITIATPFKGTPVAFLAPLLRLIRIYPDSAEQLDPDSKFTQDFLRLMVSFPDVHFTNYRSERDEFVPFAYTGLADLCPSVTEITIPGRLHASVGYAPEIAEKIRELEKSPYPTIFVAGFGLNDGYFQRIVKKALGYLPDKFYFLCYDYTERLTLPSKILAPTS